jgi:CheY-like chemotaxis protein
MAFKRPPVVAIFNSSEDVIQVLRQSLEAEGFPTVTAHVPDIKSGKEDLLAFLDHHDPAVIVYDVSVPYQENWTFLQLIRDTEAAGRRAFIVTTTNKRALEEIVGPTNTTELIGKPYDLEVIVRAVHQALEH